MKRIVLLIVAALLLSGAARITRGKAFWKAKTELKKVKKSDLAAGKIEVLDPHPEFSKGCGPVSGTSKAQRVCS